LYAVIGVVADVTVQPCLVLHIKVDPIGHEVGPADPGNMDESGPVRCHQLRVEPIGDQAETMRTFLIIRHTGVVKRWVLRFPYLPSGQRLFLMRKGRIPVP
jgi:hypothetical protein